MRYLKVISLSLVFALLISTINISFLEGKASAASQPISEDEVEELAGVLEALFEESMYYDSEGNVGINTSVLEKKVAGTTYSHIINDIEDYGLAIDDDNAVRKANVFDSPNEGMIMLFSKSKRDQFVDNCIVTQLSDSLGVGAVTLVVEAIKQKDFGKAAKELLKMGVKGGGIIITLGWILTTCLAKADRAGL